ncbi:hypothetical protein HDV05_002635, partial [Chytridiales sp. JEL 0842]
DAGKILEESERWRFEPRLTTDDICIECVRNRVEEMLHSSSHDNDVAYIKNCIDEKSDIQYWLSKPWHYEWKKKAPQFVDSEGIPSPSSGQWRSHVICPHGGLQVDPSKRRPISETAYEFLKTQFPDFETLTVEHGVEECLTCEVEKQSALEASAANRERAAMEKVCNQIFQKCSRSNPQFIEKAAPTSGK